ncbi:hypothetical protein MKX01_014790 [Papaver californicum]|nr:hypothetical protein MKX01_014790 [Papaver californicum]
MAIFPLEVKLFWYQLHMEMRYVFSSRLIVRALLYLIHPLRGRMLKFLLSMGSQLVPLLDYIPMSPLSPLSLRMNDKVQAIGVMDTNVDVLILEAGAENHVFPQLSCPIALFTYYNPILKRGVGKFMTTLKDVGLVVPDVPLEETEILRKEALKNNIELILLTTPTTPTKRMKSIVDASEGFVYLVSSIGVTSTRSSVSLRVESLLQDIKKASGKPVAVGFGISKPKHVKLVAGWGADGVIVGSVIVKILGEPNSPEEGLKELEAFTKSLKAALP